MRPACLPYSMTARWLLNSQPLDSEIERTTTYPCNLARPMWQNVLQTDLATLFQNCSAALLQFYQTHSRERGTYSYMLHLPNCSSNRRPPWSWVVPLNPSPSRHVA